MNIGKYDVMLVRERTKIPAQEVVNPAQLYDLINNKLQLFRAPCEELYALYLNAKQQIFGYELVSKGGLMSANCSPREVFRGAILKNAASIIVAHSHPSGDASPSTTDIATTKILYDASKVIGIELIDHLIVCENSFTSMRNAGYF